MFNTLVQTSKLYQIFKRIPLKYLQNASDEPCIYFGTNLIVRWRKVPRRKPRWAPRAPSKLFTIYPQTLYPDEINKSLRQIANVHRTQMRSMRTYFKAENEKRLGISEIGFLKREEEKLEIKNLLEENEKENERVRKIRETVTSEMLQKDMELLLEKDAKLKETIKSELVEMDELVRKQKKLSEHFITHSTLEASIEQALSNVVNHNFAIDLDGNFYPESAPSPEEVTEAYKNTKQ